MSFYFAGLIFVPVSLVLGKSIFLLLLVSVLPSGDHCRTSIPQEQSLVDDFKVRLLVTFAQECEQFMQCTETKD